MGEVVSFAKAKADAKTGAKNADGDERSRRLSRLMQKLWFARCARARTSEANSLIAQNLREAADALAAYHLQAELEDNDVHVEIARLLLSTLVFELQAHGDGAFAEDALFAGVRGEFERDDWRTLSLSALERANADAGTRPADTEN